MSDLTINGLVSAHSDNIQADKTLLPTKLPDGTDEYRVVFTLRGGQTRTLIIHRQLASSSEIRGLQTLEQFYLYGDTNCGGFFDSGDCLQWDNPDPECSLSNTNIAVKNALCPGGVYDSNFNGISIDKDTGKIYKNGVPSDNGILPGGVVPYSRTIAEDPGANVDANDVNDFFEITYNDASYPLPDIGHTKNKNDRIIQDLRITDVDMSTEGKVFFLKITLQHRDFGNRYSIRIVCPYNF